MHQNRGINRTFVPIIVRVGLTLPVFPSVYYQHRIIRRTTPGQNRYAMTFQELNLIEPLKRAVAEKGYTTPTPIQQQAIPLTNDLFDNDSFCMAGLRTRTLGIYEKDTGRSIVCDVAGFPYTLIWSALSKPLRFVCIEPWNSLPASVDDPQEWEQRAAAACLAPGGEWSTTLSTTFNR